jgi:hypothetical protein
MKSELKDADINVQLSCTTVSAQLVEGNIAQMLHAKSLKDITPEQRKKEASKPIYLVRYE